MDMVGGLTVSNGPARKLVWDKNALMQSTLNETNAARPHGPPKKTAPEYYSETPQIVSWWSAHRTRVVDLGCGPRLMVCVEVMIMGTPWVGFQITVLVSLSQRSRCFKRNTMHDSAAAR